MSCEGCGAPLEPRSCSYCGRERSWPQRPMSFPSGVRSDGPSAVFVSLPLQEHLTQARPGQVIPVRGSIFGGLLGGLLP